MPKRCLQFLAFRNLYGPKLAKLLTIARHVAIIVAENDCEPVTLNASHRLVEGSNASKLKARKEKLARRDQQGDQLTQAVMRHV